jgi:hypothetical protein
MTERYHANNKETPQGVANVEVLLFNHLMQEGWKRANRTMERASRAMEKSKQSNGKSKQSNGKDFISS